MTTTKGMTRDISLWPLVPVMLTCFFAGALYGWSALIAPVQDRFGVSAADAGQAFSLALVSFTLAVLLIPLMTRGRASLRLIAALGMMAGACLLMALRASSYGMFLIWFSGGFGALSGSIYTVALSIAARTAFRSVATPVLVASFGAGGAVFGPLWRVLSAQGLGLHGLWFLIGGLLIAALLALGADNKALARPAGQGEMASGASPERDTRRILLLWLVFAFGSYSGLMVLGMAAVMMDAAGVGLMLAGLTLAGVAVGNTAGRLSAALLSRSSGLSGCLAVSFGATFLGLALMLIGDDRGRVVAVGLVCVAAGYGLLASTVPLITQVAFGPSAFQRRFAVIFTAWGVAGLCAPWSAGVLFDLSGHFRVALFSAVGATVVFGICAYLTSREITRILP